MKSTLLSSWRAIYKPFIFYVGVRARTVDQIVLLNRVRGQIKPLKLDQIFFFPMIGENTRNSHLPGII